MSQITVSSAQVSSYASSILSLNQQVQAVFSAIRQEMQQVQSVWNSPAGQALMEQFSALSPNFDAYVQLLDSYGAYLNSTAQAYQENETALQSAISA